MTEKLRESMILGMGNPLLDMSVVCSDDNLLVKYNMKPNDAILAGENHKSLYEELSKHFEVEYIAGGSAQNSMRVAQWIVGKPKVTVYIGCVGKDDYSAILEKKAKEDGVDVKYQYTGSKPTGTCAVIITRNGTSRSLCANLAAAECFTKDHLEQTDVKRVLQSADYFYSSSFFLTVSTETILEVAQISHSRNKTFMLNLSAPFLTTLFKKEMMQVMPYVDILFGNESEAHTFAKEHNFKTDDLTEIAIKISKLPKQNANRQRIVIITHGTDPVILIKDGKSTEFPVKKILDKDIVDTNGAGDAFVGGFISQLLKEESIETCIKCGIWAAGEIVKKSGCTFSGPANFQP